MMCRAGIGAHIDRSALWSHIERAGCHTCTLKIVERVISSLGGSGEIMHRERLMRTEYRLQFRHMNAVVRRSLVMLIVILLGLSVAIVAGTVLAGVAFYDVAFTAAGQGSKAACGCSGCGGCSKRTSPEALAIAALVQRSLPRSEVERIQNWTKGHARVVADKTVCPMMSDDGSCLVFASQSTVDAVL